MSSINEFRCTSRTIHLVPYVRLPAVSIGAAGGQLPGDSPTIFAAGEINFPNFFLGGGGGRGTILFPFLLGWEMEAWQCARIANGS